MACPNSLWTVDSLIIDGEAYDVEENSVEVDGIVPWENEVVKNANSNAKDGIKRKRVERRIKAKVLFKGAVIEQITQKLSQVCDSQIVLLDNHAKKRLRFGSCAIGKVGAIGKGEGVDCEFLPVSNGQWLG